jgi:hypothetical protein
VCVCEAMGDATAGPWKGTTEDSSAWEASTVEVNGKWRVVDNPLVDATYLEVAEYCKFRRRMMRYIYFVWGGERERTLPEAVKTDLAALEDMIDVFPTKSQVLRQHISGVGGVGDGVIRYHTSYLVFSDNQPFTRSAMLARLPAVVVRMKRLNPVFTQALIEVTRASFDELCTNVGVAYETWRRMAEANLRVFLSHLRGREEGGRTFRGAVGLEELLLELKMLRGEDVHIDTKPATV